MVLFPVCFALLAIAGFWLGALRLMSPPSM